MTYFEKYRLEHPDDRSDDLVIAETFCPGDVWPDIQEAPESYKPLCGLSFDCLECWDKQVPSTETPTETPPSTLLSDNKETTPTQTKTKTEPVTIHFPVYTKEPFPMTRATVDGGTDILDSGDRTEFPSGAVRDMRAGKGRFDVMPLEVLSQLTGSAVIGYIANFMQDMSSTDELYEALSAFCEEAFNNDIWTMLLETAIHYEQGALKYGPWNWQRGIPTWCYIDSATRHYVKWRRGDKDEDHRRAFVWNVLCCIWEVDHNPNHNLTTED